MAKRHGDKISARKKPVRLMASGKLSNYRVERIVRLYAANVRATEAARQTGISYPTVRSTYAAIRKRMLELQVYFSTSWHVEGHKEGEGDFWNDTVFYLKLDREIALRRGVTDASRGDHEAEILYRQNARAAYGPDYAAWHGKIVLALIRRTGPLNREVPAEKAQKAMLWYMDRAHERFMTEVDREDMSRDLADAEEQEAIADFSEKQAARDRRKKRGG